MGRDGIGDLSSPAGKAQLESILDDLGTRQSLGVPADGEKAGAIDGRYVSFVGTGAEQEVAHALGRAPLGFLVAGKSATGDVWQPGTRTSNEQVVYLAGTAGVTFKVLLY